MRNLFHGLAILMRLSADYCVADRSTFRVVVSMNPTLSLLYSHHSDRSFTDEPVSDEALCAILEAARRAPTSSNAQHLSMIVVGDPARRARIAELAGGQSWIAKAPVFIAAIVDFHKTGVGVAAAGETQQIHETLEGLVAAVTDAGIALATMMTAARSQGLGIVPIGGIRRSPQAMIELLELPPHCFPVVGLTIGHVKQPGIQKPRLPMEVFRHDERYQREGIAEAIAAYDATLVDYWKHIGRTDGLPWSKNTADAYKGMMSRQVKAAMEKQGLKQDR
jgi:FMN reductase [NAD(P)H]